MYTKSLFAAFAAAVGVSAQGNGTLVSLINSRPELAQLGDILTAYPSVAATLAGVSNVTLLAPNNQAIKAIQSTLVNASIPTVNALLSYHLLQGMLPAAAFSDTPVFAPTYLSDNDYDLVPGGQVVELVLDGMDATIVSGYKAVSTVVTPNLRYNGGIVHVIDTVLTIPPAPSVILPAAGLTDTLGALVATNLSATLDMTAYITLFAPSNAAFRAIGSAAANLTIPQLARILEYHVVPGHAAYSTDIVSGSYPTLLGTNLNIEVLGEAVYVNGARVINADILISNGVLHVIDEVLNPMNATAMPMNGSSIPQFASVSSASLPAALTSSLPLASSTYSALAATTSSVLA